MKKRVLFVVIALLCFIAGFAVGYVVRDNSNSSNKDVASDKKDVVADDEEQQNDDELVDPEADVNEDTFEDFAFSEITSIIIEVPCQDCEDPETDTITVTDEKELRFIIANLDKAEFVSEISAESGVGSIGAMTIEIIYSEGQDPSAEVVFLANGNVAINYSVGVAETTFAEYKLTNAAFKQELLDKYSK